MLSQKVPLLFGEDDSFCASFFVRQFAVCKSLRLVVLACLFETCQVFSGEACSCSAHAHVGMFK